MDKAEAFLAVHFNSICENRGIQYYAVGLEYIKEIGKPARENIVLHDMKVNSHTHAPYAYTKVVDWKAPDWLVEKELNKIRSRLNK